MPAEIYQILIPGTIQHPEKIPEEIFNTCTPTKGSREVVKVPTGAKWMALDFISAAGIGTFAVSIDEHPMWIYAVDGAYIEPLKVDALSLMQK